MLIAEVLVDVNKVLMLCINAICTNKKVQDTICFIPYMHLFVFKMFINCVFFVFYDVQSGKRAG